jgi:ATP-dependent DNA helicase RecG
MELPSPEEVFSNALTPLSNLTHNVESLTHSNLENQPNINDSRDAEGRFISEKIDKPFVDDLVKLTEDFRLKLNALGIKSREQSRLDVDTMKQLIKELCKGHYISVSVLEVLLDRKAQSLRQNYLKPMVSDGALKMAFPHKPNSPMQGYTVSE